MSPYVDFHGTPLPYGRNGQPLCPQCGESDLIHPTSAASGEHHWCGRYNGWIRTLSPRPGRHVPMFDDK